MPRISPLADFSLVLNCFLLMNDSGNLDAVADKAGGICRAPAPSARSLIFAWRTLRKGHRGTFRRAVRPEDTCTYAAPRTYIDSSISWSVHAVIIHLGPDDSVSSCIFHSDNNVVDHRQCRRGLLTYQRLPRKQREPSSLYLPGRLLREGGNRIIVFQSEGRAADYLDVRGDAVLG